MTASECSAVVTGRVPRSYRSCMVSLLTERSLEGCDEYALAAVRTDAAVEHTGATAWYQEADAPGLAIRRPSPSEQSEHLQDDDDHHDRADDVEERVHWDLFPQPP